MVPHCFYLGPGDLNSDYMDRTIFLALGLVFQEFLVKHWNAWLSQLGEGTRAGPGNEDGMYF